MFILKFTIPAKWWTVYFLFISTSTFYKMPMVVEKYCPSTIFFGNYYIFISAFYLCYYFYYF